MVQGGYCSPSSQKTLTVKQKSNILDKSRSKTTSNSNASSRNRNSSPVTAGIDVSKEIYFRIIFAC